jgi:hypothetical protein
MGIKGAPPLQQRLQSQAQLIRPAPPRTPQAS